MLQIKMEESVVSDMCQSVTLTFDSSMFFLFQLTQYSKMEQQSHGPILISTNLRKYGDDCDVSDWSQYERARHCVCYIKPPDWKKIDFTRYSRVLLSLLIAIGLRPLAYSAVSFVSFQECVTLPRYTLSITAILKALIDT